MCNNIPPESILYILYINLYFFSAKFANIYAVRTDSSGVFLYSVMVQSVSFTLTME